VEEISCFKTIINITKQINNYKQNTKLNITKLKVNKMKTIFTKSFITALAIATALFTQTANAKIEKSKVENTPIASQYDFDLLTEINNVIKNVIGEVEKPAIKKTIAKQLTADTVQLKANELVQEVDKTLPKFKFKVVIKD
jgi:hypothetical protein